MVSIQLFLKVSFIIPSLMLDILDSPSASIQRRQPDGRGSSAHEPLSPDAPRGKKMRFSLTPLKREIREFTMHSANHFWGRCLVAFKAFYNNF